MISFILYLRRILAPIVAQNGLKVGVDLRYFHFAFLHRCLASDQAAHAIVAVPCLALVGRLVDVDVLYDLWQ